VFCDFPATAETQHYDEQEGEAERTVIMIKKRVANLSQQLTAAGNAAPAAAGGRADDHIVGGGALWREAAVPKAATSVEELLSRYEVQTATNIEYVGMNHVALVCSDMAKTLRFFGDVLGLRLSKTIDIGNGGQHFFFDVGKGAQLAYFWFPEAPKAVDGVSRAAPPGFGQPTALGSMHHLAFNVETEEELLACKARLEKHNVQEVVHMIHADTATGEAETWKDPLAVWNSIYFGGPDGEYLEVSVTARPIGGTRDVNLMPNPRAKFLDEEDEYQKTAAAGSTSTTESSSLAGMGANWREQILRPPASRVSELVKRYGSPKPDGMRLTGLNHIALVSSDMERTVRFYGEVLGLRLSKTLDIGIGQHFFFDIGNDAQLAYFWFPEVAKAKDGVSRVSMADFMAPPEKGIFPKTAVGSMHHFAIRVKDERSLISARTRLKERGLFVTPVVLHADNVPGGVTQDPRDPRIIFRSIYFFGPDGENLELSVTERDLGGPRDIEHMPGGKAQLI